MEENKVKLVEEKAYCPYCGKQTTSSDRFCQNCGGYLGKKQEPKEEANDSEIKESVAMRICEGCGRAFPRNLERCPICGNKNDTVRATQDTRKPFNFWAVIALVCSLSISGILGLIFASIASNKEGEFRKPMHGMSKAARILGILSIVITAVYVVVVLVMYLGGLSDFYSEIDNNYGSYYY
jgi:RNA polymerase subunit RPABC4/transcription elongation factor Spt4